MLFILFKEIRKLFSYVFKISIEKSMISLYLILKYRLIIIALM